MPVCTRCNSLNCQGDWHCTTGKCKNCGGYSCKGNCTTPIGKTRHALLQCAVCRETYSRIHICKGPPKPHKR